MKTLGKIFGAVLGVAVLAAPAVAQKNMPTYGEEDKGLSQSEKAAEREAEKAYRRSLGNIPESQKSSDPWGTMRGDSAAPKAATKAATKAPAKPKAKSAADGAAKQ